jgi:hypothetical protein
MDYARQIRRSREWQERLNKFRFISSLTLAITFTIVGGVLDFAEMVVITAVASVIPGPRAFAYLLERHRPSRGAAANARPDVASSAGHPKGRLAALVVVLCISVVLLVVAARQWGALVAAIGSVVLYFAEFLIAREMRRRGTW